MTIDEFIDKVDFNNEIEKADAKHYLKFKGIGLHLQVAKYLGHDLNIDGESIEWHKLSSMLRYDKKLRDKLYIYLATFEEYLRACIINEYADNPIQDFWMNFKYVKIKDRIQKNEPLFDIISDTTLGEIIKQIKKIPNKEKFFDCNNIEQNLDAVNILRNAIGHHKFLFGTRLGKCYLGNIPSYDLVSNIKNLRQLLPIEYRYGSNGEGGITKDINECAYELKNKSLMDIPINTIIKI